MNTSLITKLLTDQHYQVTRDVKGNNTEVSQQISPKISNIFNIGVKQMTAPLCISENKIR